ncbi:MAG: hypothetical protein WDO13_00060 [Verrucomicrobiota bacterium]
MKALLVALLLPSRRPRRPRRCPAHRRGGKLLRRRGRADRRPRRHVTSILSDPNQDPHEFTSNARPRRRWPTPTS